MIRPIHPFPARMAPELAVTRLRKLPAQSVILDPMSGSGTVIRQATEIGHEAVGFDLDPLAVLMTRVWTMPVDDNEISALTAAVLEAAQRLDADDISLPWIDDDRETAEFVQFWFGARQRADLRRLAYVLWHLDSSNAGSQRGAVADVLRIALSRLIIVKENGASLARDVSHSRPHKVVDRTDFQVFAAFEHSARQVGKDFVKHLQRPAQK